MTPRIKSTGLFVSLWVAMTLAATARAAVVDDPVMALLATLFWAMVQGAGLWFARANDGPLPKVTEAIAAVGLVAFLAELLIGGLVQALMSLLLWLQAARNPVLRTRRDTYFALAIGLTLVMFGATDARSGAYLAVLVGFGFAALLVLVYCHQQQGWEAQVAGDASSGTENVRALPLAHIGALGLLVFIIASAWYLLVPRPDALQFGAVATRGGDKYSNEDWESEAKGNKRPARRDRLEGGKSDGPGRGERPSHPNDEELDIRHPPMGHDGLPPNAIVMFVQADQRLYLRERTFDRFIGDRWDRSEASTRKLLPSEGKFYLPGPESGAKSEYVVQVVHARTSAVPLSAQAKTLSAPVSVVALAKDGAVYLPARIGSGFRYGAMSVLPEEGQDRPIAYDSSEPRKAYLQLPDDFSNRIGELAQEVAGGSSSPLQKAVALESHLRSAYAYSFDTVFTSQGVTPLEEFLFVTKRGHCEFFASALAVMLRSIGIPSRVVNGYLAQSYNPVTGFYEVRVFDGHAWVEAYIDGVGWMTFEPTAAYPVPQRSPQSGTALRDLKEYTEKLSKQEALRGVTSIMGTVAEVMRTLSEAWYELVLRVRLALEAGQAWVIANAVALVVALMALTALAVVGYRNRQRLSWWVAMLIVRASPSERVSIVAVRQIERVARGIGSGKAPGETVDEYLSKLESRYPDLHSELDVLRREFNVTRYDQQGASSARSAGVVDAFRAVGARLEA